MSTASCSTIAWAISINSARVRKRVDVPSFWRAGPVEGMPNAISGSLASATMKSPDRYPPDRIRSSFSSKRYNFSSFGCSELSEAFRTFPQRCKRRDHRNPHDSKRGQSSRHADRPMILHTGAHARVHLFRGSSVTLKLKRAESSSTPLSRDDALSLARGFRARPSFGTATQPRPQTCRSGAHDNGA